MNGAGFSPDKWRFAPKCEKPQWRRRSDLEIRNRKKDAPDSDNPLIRIEESSGNPVRECGQAGIPFPLQSSPTRCPQAVRKREGDPYASEASGQEDQNVSSAAPQDRPMRNRHKRRNLLETEFFQGGLLQSPPIRRESIPSVSFRESEATEEYPLPTRFLAFSSE